MIGVEQKVRAVSYRLLRAVDAQKDQSYVLFGLRRELLRQILFPTGGYCKSEIREIARGLGLRVADKPDSQEICFVPSGRYADFVHRRRSTEARGGPMVDTAGNVLGRHEGIEHFTIGQRRGIKLAFGEPRYVVALDAPNQRVVIGTRDELARGSFEVRQSNWLIDLPDQPLRCRVKIRYRNEAASATVEALSADRTRVVFDEAQFGVAPGQAAVFYDGPRVLGGGWIE